MVMSLLFFVVVLLSILHGYWFFRVSRLRDAARRTESELKRRCEALSRDLARSRERFDWYAEKSRDVVYQMSVPDGRYTYVNQAAVDYHGYTREEFLSQPMLIAHMLHPDYHKIFAEEWARIVAGEAYGEERDFQIYNKHGELRWLHHDVRVVNDENGRPILVDGLVVDITDQKRTENALRESEADLRRAQEVAQLGTWRLDMQTGTIVCSPQTCRIFEIETTEEMRSERFWWFTHADDRAKVDAAWNEALAGKAFDLEYRITTNPSGATRWVYNRAELESGPVGTCTLAVGVIQDITKRKLLELELLQAQKMEAVGTLAGGIAHDFNNALSVILGYSEMLMRKLGDHAEGKEEVRSILDATERARNLVRQIVTYSRKVEPQRFPLNLNNEAVRIQDVWRRILPRAIHIDLRLADDLKLVSADAGQVGQILMNLVTNAVDAMGGSGEMTVTTSNVTMRGHACTHCGERLDGEMVCLTLSDTGCGIPPENLAKIFDSFFTTKEAGRGTGLGLSSVLGIVDRHGGHIECESVVGSGTKFHVYLPALSEPETETPIRAETATIEPTGNETILLVEDEEDLLEINCVFLASAGYTVIAACNGTDALEQYRQKQHQVDLIVTDLNMPGLSVDEYLMKIIAINPEARLIALSGYVSMAEASKLAPEGIASFLAKPYYRADLLCAVRNALDRRP